LQHAIGDGVAGRGEVDVRGADRLLNAERRARRQAAGGCDSGCRQQDAHDGTRQPHLRTVTRRHGGCFSAGMFFFFSNRLGCAGSILVTLVGSALLLALMRGCSGAAPAW
jgi:hypothetical protein